MIKVAFSSLALLGAQLLYAQNSDWFNRDLEASGILGISVDRAYEAIGSSDREDIIVAIIDSGVDIGHEDLKDNIWINEDEIPANGLDDDNNGYIDDINGWNFLGGPDGQSVVYETYGEVRHFRALRRSFEGRDTTMLQGAELIKYQKMKSMGESIRKKAASSEKELISIAQFDETLSQVKFLLKPFIEDEEVTKELISSINPANDGIKAAKEIMLQLLESGFNEEEFDQYKEYHRIRKDFHYNVEYDPRGLVGDDPEDPYERYYGNNDVFGAHADHGTHVAGIIGAVRGNEVGIDGIAQNVKLMILRAVPDGDERDKDIANAILYAVENGAKVINMSFGKGYSPHKKAVDAAVKKAEAKGVLIVHAAGNAAVDIDEATHFPIETFEDGTIPSNWIEVGASDKKPNELLVADFSNYGRMEVDVFAPGVDIYSTMPNNQYGENSGTSMAAPVVSALAAALWSYDSTIPVKKLKMLILEGALSFKNLKVYYPDTSGLRDKKTKFKKLSVTGGVVNLYNSMVEAGHIVNP